MQQKKHVSKSSIYRLSPDSSMSTNCLLPLTSQLCRFTTPVPHLAVYTGSSDFSSASPSLPFLANSSTACPSPISLALDSVSASERRLEAFEGDGEGTHAAPAAAAALPSANHGNVSKSGVGVSLRRLLRRGCTPSAVFASLSPKCPSATGTGSRIQPMSPDQPSQAPPRRISKYNTIYESIKSVSSVVC